MLHLTGPHPPDTFASLLHVLKARECLDALGPLKALGIQSANALVQASSHTLRASLGDVLLDRLLHGPQAPQRGRADIPTVHPYRRGSLQRVGLSPAPVQSPLEAPTPANFRAWDSAYEQDKFSRTSRAPRASRWNTWQAMCASRQIPPLPVTPRVIDAVGALFKQGRYRSARGYFSVAKSMHRSAGHEWSPELDFFIASALRSITRGMGPDKPKLALRMLQFTLSDVDLLQAWSRAKGPECAPPLHPRACAVGATWFLLRGIELAAVQCQDVHFNKTLREVRLCLPVSKQDQSAKGCNRAHRCICLLQHDTGCKAQGSSSELLFTRLQRCKCVTGYNPLCVFHALLDLALALRSARLWEPTGPFFCDARGGELSKGAVVRLARALATQLHGDALPDWSGPAVQAWAEHTFRVSGAQMLAMSGVDQGLIQLLGRWGSDAVLRYIQEAPLADTSVAARAVSQNSSSSGAAVPPVQQPPPCNPLTDQVRVLVKDALTQQCAASVFVLNPKSKLAHRPSSTEGTSDSAFWLSACGRWRYGNKSHTRNPAVPPGYSKCKTCFPEDTDVAPSASGSDSGSSDSSTSS